MPTGGNTRDTSPLPTERLVVQDNQWGPERPLYNNDVDQFDTAKYLTGYANKISHDLVKVARLYNGRLARFYAPCSKTRCSYCTNKITGEKLLSDCPECGGTGWTGGWDVVGEYWVYGDIGAKYHIATVNGNSEAEGSNRDRYILVGCPTLIIDNYLMIFKGNKDVYKIYDVEPFIVAMHGTVVAQVLSAAGITPGSTEFNLPDW